MIPLSTLQGAVPDDPVAHAGKFLPPAGKTVAATAANTRARTVTAKGDPGGN